MSDISAHLPLQAKNILFICTGNLCQSISGEVILKTILAREGLNIEVDSAGTNACPGGEIPLPVLRLLQKEGFDGSDYCSRKVTRGMIEKADIIFVMEFAHRKFILAEMPEAKDKVFLLSAFYPPHEKFLLEKEIPDPIGRSDFFHENVNEMIRLCCEGILSRLKTAVRVEGN